MLRLDLILFLLGAILATPGSPAAAALLDATGGWYLSQDDAGVRISLSWHDPDGRRRSNWTTDFEPSALDGFDPAALERPKTPLAFRLRRDAGAFVCEGRTVALGRAAGDWRLDPDPDFGPALAKRGYQRPTPVQQFEMAWSGWTSWHARAMDAPRSTG